MRLPVLRQNLFRWPIWSKCSILAKALFFSTLNWLEPLFTNSLLWKLFSRHFSTKIISQIRLPVLRQSLFRWPFWPKCPNLAKALFLSTLSWFLVTTYELREFQEDLLDTFQLNFSFKWGYWCFVRVFSDGYCGQNYIIWQTLCSFQP